MPTNEELAARIRALEKANRKLSTRLKLSESKSILFGFGPVRTKFVVASFAYVIFLQSVVVVLNIDSTSFLIFSAILGLLGLVVLVVIVVDVFLERRKSRKIANALRRRPRIHVDIE